MLALLAGKIKKPVVRADASGQTVYYGRSSDVLALDVSISISALRLLPALTTHKVLGQAVSHGAVLGSQIDAAEDENSADSLRCEKFFI